MNSHRGSIDRPLYRASLLAASLGLRAPVGADPATLVQLPMAARLDDAVSSLADPVVQRLNGRNGMRFSGQTRPAQVLTHTPLEIAVDPVGGIGPLGAGLWPSLPSRSPAVSAASFGGAGG